MVQVGEKRVFRTDWAAIRGLYLQGVDSMTLANKFAINVSTLRSKASREGWNEILGKTRKQIAISKEVTQAAARDIWAERRETIRERIHYIGDRMTQVAAQLPEDQLLSKAEKIKIATEIAGKSVGLDRQEDGNVVNLAILGSLGASASTPSISIIGNDVANELQSETIEGAFSFGSMDSEPMLPPTTHPTTVEGDTATPPL